MIAITQGNKKPELGIKKQWTGQRLLAFPSPRARIFPFVSKNQPKIIELDSLAGRLTRSGENDIALACIYPAIFGAGLRKLQWNQWDKSEMGRAILSWKCACAIYKRYPLRRKE